MVIKNILQVFIKQTCEKNVLQRQLKHQPPNDTCIARLNPIIRQQKTYRQGTGNRFHLCCVCLVIGHSFAAGHGPQGPHGLQIGGTSEAKDGPNDSEVGANNYHVTIYRGFLKWGLPPNGWFISWKILLKWKMTRGTPIYGTPQMVYDTSNYSYSGLHTSC